MRLDRNICSKCGEKNFSDSEYHIPLSMCNGCFEKKQKDMVKTINNLQEQVTNLEQEKVEASANTQQNIIKDDSGSKLIKSLLVLGIFSGIVFYSINSSDEVKEKKVQVENEIFQDNQTGLTWQDNSDVKIVQKDWSEANEYCANLTTGEYSDWRLPNYNELLSIIDYEKYNPAIKKGFKNVASDYYWSSSPNVSNSSEAWGVNFEVGYAYYGYKSDSYHVRCVRGRQ